MRFWLLAFLAVAAVTPMAAKAHPHIFIDSAIGYVFDDAGNLKSVTVEWTYDGLVTLYVVETRGFDSDGDGELTAEEKAFFAKEQTTWQGGFDGDLELLVDDAPVKLGGPYDASADFVDGRFIVRYTRDIEGGPVAIAENAVGRMYDPTYYIAYQTPEPPTVVNAPAACAPARKGHEVTQEIASLEMTLSMLSREQTPDQAGVGRLFADQMVVTCG